MLHMRGRTAVYYLVEIWELGSGLGLIQLVGIMHNFHALFAIFLLVKDFVKDLEFWKMVSL